MNIRRYVAADMRSAFKLVRDELGPDVVILSTRRVRGQIELTVAIDTQPVGSATPLPAFAAEARPSSPERTATERSSTERFAMETVAIPASVNQAIDGELRAMRKLLETQLMSLSWNDMARRSPVVAELLREMTAQGFDDELSRTLVDGIGSELALDEARRLLTAALKARLEITGDRWMEQGGKVVVVGPAGAGKTTALAALAARWVMRNGAQGTALISAGESRFGVQENLARVGRLVGIPVYVLDKVSDLPELLQRLTDRRMVLIDTAGVSPRHAGFERHINELRHTLPDADFALTLSAATQAGTVREVIAAHRNLGNLSCILTHTDECTTLGGLLSSVIEAQLPVAYTMDGPRLLDDLRPARAELLVELAFDLGQRQREAVIPVSRQPLEGRIRAS